MTESEHGYTQANMTVERLRGYRDGLADALDWLITQQTHDVNLFNRNGYAKAVTDLIAYRNAKLAEPK